MLIFLTKQQLEKLENNSDQMWLVFNGVIKMKYLKIGKFCLLYTYLSRGYGRKFKRDCNVSTVELRVFSSLYCFKHFLLYY